MQLFKSLFGGGVASVSVADLQARLEAGDVVVLDVREPDETREGYIKGAKLIPLGQLGQRHSELPKDKDIFVVCRSGGRSASAASQLHGAGYRVFNVAGGMMAWAGQGLPMKKGK